MSLKGKAKTDYQREYMRRKRGLTVKNIEAVRPSAIGFLVANPKPAPQLDADGNPIPDYD